MMLPALISGPDAGRTARARSRCGACGNVLADMPAHWQPDVFLRGGVGATIPLPQHAESIIVRCRNRRCGMWNELRLTRTAAA
jgi:hypothetical protein